MRKLPHSDFPTAEMAQSVPMHRLRAHLLSILPGVTTVEAPTPQPEVPPSSIPDEALGIPVCHTCGVSFEDFFQQRAHFKSDWHVENVRRASAGRPIVDESLAACVSRFPVRAARLFVPHAVLKKILAVMARIQMPRPQSRVMMHQRLLTAPR